MEPSRDLDVDTASCIGCGEVVPKDELLGYRAGKWCHEDCPPYNGEIPVDERIKVAYADPPYPGMAKKHYSDDPKCGEVDHEQLVESLRADFPDGWALSTHVPALPMVFDIIRDVEGVEGDGLPDGYRVGSWVKPFAVFKVNVNPAYAWEPVIFYGGRPRTRAQKTIKDWHQANITLQTGTPGAKPPSFCEWVFKMLNLKPGDELWDLFPGSGNVGEAWEKYSKQVTMEPWSGSL